MNEVDVKDKIMLTIKEAAQISNVGENKIRELIERRDCNFTLHIGTKTLVKRKKFEEYLMLRDVI